jgi:hypothetical protein
MCCCCSVAVYIGF